MNFPGYSVSELVPIVTPALASEGTSPSSESPQPVHPTERVASHSFQQRVQLWQNALSLIRKEPVTGYFGKEPILRQALSVKSTGYVHFHNLFLDVAVRFGVIWSLYSLFSIVLAPVIIVVFMVRYGKKDNNFLNGLAYLCLFYFCYFFVENLVDVNYYQKEVFSVVVAVSALAGIAIGILRSDGRPSAPQEDR